VNQEEAQALLEVPEVALYMEMQALLTRMREARPTERTETARRWAVSITEMEKATAYFYAYVVEAVVE
jgi:predicted Mrr-cat superfamily restriction endonuclease